MQKTAGILSPDFIVSFKYLLLLSLLTPLNTWALILGIPVAGTGFSAILTNGPATISWSTEPGDPQFISFQLQNNVTLDSFEIATNVPVSSGSITKNMTDVPGSEHYFMQAVDVAKIKKVLSVAGPFIVAGSSPPTTNLPTPTSSMPRISAGAATQTQTITATASSSQPPGGTPVPQDAAKTQATTVKIVGGVIGGLLFIALLAAFVFLYRRRQRHRHMTVFSHISDEEEHSRMTQNRTNPTPLSSTSTVSPFQPTETSASPTSAGGVTGRLAQVVSEKQEMRRMRENLQSAMASGGTERGDAVGQLDSVTALPVSTGDSDLRRQVELMSERIQQLEAQQQHLEVQQQSLNQDSLVDQPPGYTSSP